MFGFSVALEKNGNVKKVLPSDALLNPIREFEVGCKRPEGIKQRKLLLRQAQKIHQNFRLVICRCGMFNHEGH